MLYKFLQQLLPFAQFLTPDFSLQSFEIFNLNFVYKLLLTQYRSMSSFVMLDLLLQELMPFAKK